MFRLNARLANELENEVAYRLRLAEVGHKVADRVRAHDVMRTKNKDKIVVVADGDDVLVGNTDHGAHLDEWGSVNNPPSAPLRTSVRAAGLRLDEHGK